MNGGASSVVRARAVECLIACCAVAAGWHFALRPADAALASERAVLESVQSLVASDPNAPATAAAVQVRADSTAQRLAALEDAEQALGAGGRLYDALNRLAQTSAIKITRLDPTGLRALPAVRGGDGAGSTVTGDVQGYRMTIRGRYAAVVKFIHECEHSLGLCGVNSFRITPIGEHGRDEVEAVLETGHLRLNHVETKPARRRGGTR